METTVYETPVYRIGKTDWKLIVFRDNKATIAPSVSGLDHFTIGPQRFTRYQYLDYGTWRNDVNHPRYDPHNGSTHGLPVGLKRIYFSNETEIKKALQEPQIMTDQTTHTPGPWYTKSKPTDRQGLICSESTGENIAVSYEAKDAPIIAASTEMLEALEWITRCTKIKGPAGTTAYIISDERMRDAIAAVAKAKGEW